MPNQAEIQKQIAGLREILAKPTFRRETFFGDDNVEAVKTQIEVLENKLTEEDVDDREDMGDWSQYAADSAREAANWLSGDEDKSPVDGWDGLH